MRLCGSTRRPFVQRSYANQAHNASPARRSTVVQITFARYRRLCVQVSYQCLFLAERERRVQMGLSSFEMFFVGNLGTTENKTISRICRGGLALLVCKFLQLKAKCLQPINCASVFQCPMMTAGKTDRTGAAESEKQGQGRWSRRTARRFDRSIRNFLLLYKFLDDSWTLLR